MRTRTRAESAGSHVSLVSVVRGRSSCPEIPPTPHDNYALGFQPAIFAIWARTNASANAKGSTHPVRARRPRRARRASRRHPCTPPNSRTSCRRPLRLIDRNTHRKSATITSNAATPPDNHYAAPGDDTDKRLSHNLDQFSGTGHKLRALSERIVAGFLAMDSATSLSARPEYDELLVTADLRIRSGD